MKKLTNQRWVKNGHVTKKNYSCVVSHIIRVLIVEELQRLAKKGRSSARKIRESGIVLKKINQSALGEECTSHKKNYSCVVSHIIRVLIVEELQRLAKKGRSSARKMRESGIVLARNTTTSG